MTMLVTGPLLVIPAEAQRRAGTQNNGSIEDHWVPGLANGLARDDNRGAR